MTSKAATPEQIVSLCLVWYGRGTGGVPSRQDAVDDLVQFFKAKFVNALRNDPLRWTDADDAHVLEKLFILRCAEAIGRLAAQEATKDGVLSIGSSHVLLA